MLGMSQDDIDAGYKLFETWSESSKLKCVSTAVEYEVSKGHMLWKKWTPKHVDAIDCEYGFEPTPDYSCATKKCRNLKLLGTIPFKKEDYTKYVNNYDEKHDWMYCSMALGKKMYDREVNK